MELKEFIKGILRDIVDAVEEARTEGSRDMYLDSGKEDRTVEFDIAVTVEDSTSGTGKAGIKVFQMIEGGGELSREAKNSSVSRICFGIHVDRWTKEENIQMQESSNTELQPNYDTYS